MSLRFLRFFLSKAGPTAEPVLRSMNADELSLLRHRCDVYMDPRKNPCEVTHFYADILSDVGDWAKAALNVYNEKEKKNFNLKKVVKLNQVSMDAYLTFWAQSAESDELRLFRAAVKPLGGYNVLLCEIKDGDEMTIPAGHEECFPRIPKSEENHSPHPWLVDANGGLAAGEGCVEPDSVGWDHNFEAYHSMEDYELSNMRHKCDIYMDPRESQYGGGVTQFYVDGLSDVRDRAKAALNFYNEKNQKNFHLEKVVKLNRFSRYHYMTFWARSAESDERRLFRGGVDLLHRNKVLLCEVKDGDEMTVPAEHEEHLPQEPNSDEDYSPYTMFDLISGSADGLVDANGGSAVGEGCVELGSVGRDHNFEEYRLMEDYEFADLCRDGDEMPVLAEREEHRPQEPQSEEDCSPPLSPYTCAQGLTS